MALLFEIGGHYKSDKNTVCKLARQYIGTFGELLNGCVKEQDGENRDLDK